MKKLVIAATLAAGLGIGSFAGVQAKLPAPPAKTDAEKSAEAEKAAAAKAKEGELNAKYMDKAVANHKKARGIVEPKPTKTSAASASGKK